MRWLTGFTGTNGAAVLTRDQRLFLTDFRYTEQAEAQVDPGFERLPAGRDLVADLAAKLTGRAGFDDGHMSVSTHAKLQDKVGDGVELVAAGGAVEVLARSRTAPSWSGSPRPRSWPARRWNGSWSRASWAAASAPWRWTWSRRCVWPERPGRRFPQSWPPGPTARCRTPAPGCGDRGRAAGGPGLGGAAGRLLLGLHPHCGHGPLDQEAGEAYELVRRAQQTGLEAVRAGASCKAVDAAAREVIADAGYGDEFGHSLGHGVGRRCTRDRRCPCARRATCQVGNVVSVEPGVYLPGSFGIRIEDLVAVTDTGADVFTRLTKELVTVD